MIIGVVDMRSNNIALRKVSTILEENNLILNTVWLKRDSGD